MHYFLNQKSLISVSELSIDQIDLILKKAKELENSPKPKLLEGKILGCCFFEPSTRTRLSFEAAMLKLGGNVIGFSEATNTSQKKGETFSDTVKVIGEYADVLAIRHFEEGAAKTASKITKTPIINAGDGANQHPTQTLVDLYTIQKCQGKIHGLQLALVGDLKYSRAIHSLCLALCNYEVRLYFVSPKILEPPERIIKILKNSGIEFSFHRTIEEVIPKVDIFYLCRTQKERFLNDPTEFTEITLLKKHLKNAKENLKILHPLPRVNEMERSIDESPFAYYFEQASNGIPIRMAILALMLGSS